MMDFSTNLQRISSSSSRRRRHYNNRRIEDNRLLQPAATKLGDVVVDVLVWEGETVINIKALEHGQTSSNKALEGGATVVVVASHILSKIGNPWPSPRVNIRQVSAMNLSL